MPIRLRLGLAFAAITCVLVVVGGSLFLRSFQAGVRASLDPGLRAKAAILRQNVKAGLVTPGVQDANEGSLRGRDEVAQVLTPRGHVIATTEEAGPHSLISRRDAPATVGAAKFVRATVPDEHEPFRVLATRVATDHGDRILVVATSLEATESAIHR